MQKINKFLAVLAATLAATFLFAACNDKPDDGGKTEGPVKYTVTYTAGEGSGSAPAGGSYEAGATFALPDPTGLSKDGCTFDKWNDGTTDYAVGATYTMPAKNVTFTATWKDDDETPPTPVAKYAVTFRGGVGVDGNAPKGGSFEEGATFKLPAATGLSKPGYVFDKWDDGENKYAVGDTYTVPAHAVEFVATWKVDTTQVDPTVKYTVVVVKSALESLTSSVTGTVPTIPDKAAGETFTISADTFSLAHYTQTKWRVLKLNIDDPDYPYWETVINYDVDAEIEMPAFNIRVAAVWTKNKVTISFDANGGSGVMSSIQKDFGTNLTLPSCEFNAPTGKKFQGWSTTPNGSLLSNGTNLNDSIVGIDDTLKLYAIWETTTEPTPAITIDALVGHWSDGTHTLDIAKYTGTEEYAPQGFGVLDDKYPLMIYASNEFCVIQSRDFDLVYMMSMNGSSFVITQSLYDEETGEATTGEVITFNEKSALASKVDYNGKWMIKGKMGTNPVYITSGKVYYGTNLLQANVAVIGSKMVFYHEAISETFVVDKNGSEYKSYYDCEGQSPLSGTFTAGTFSVLTVEGKLNQIVNSGAKPNTTKITAPAAPEGKVFDKWVLADTQTEFRLDAVMTADASIVATFKTEEQGGGDVGDANVKTYVGQISAGRIEKIEINTETGVIVFTYTKVVKPTTMEMAAVQNGKVYTVDESNPTGQKLWIAISDDGNTISLYNYATMDEEDLIGTMTLA